MKCSKCNQEKIIAEQCITGFPDHYVVGSRVEYCGYCDIPPGLELVVTGKETVCIVAWRENA